MNDKGPMSVDAHILIVEDFAPDVELIERVLRKANIGFTSKHVETKEAFLRALTELEPDVVLSDYSLPQFSGLEALRLLRENGFVVPFILITGSQTEEVAVECMKEGAADYILKSNLTRLPSAVMNALKRSQSEKDKRQALSALRQSEEQLLQAQKLEAVGRLAGGVAHDFNNLLTVITGYSDLSLRQLTNEHPLHRNLTEIKTASERAASLTRQLLAFSRKQVMQPKVFALSAVVADFEKMLRRMIGEDIELRTTLEAETGNVKADPGQVEQIIMNLVVNARDAMPQGGKVTIETSNIYLDQAYARQHISVKPGEYVMLAVSDAGSGMDEETRQHIFEPFFTTKEAGKGTGLGLSMVYGIVKQSDANIWVYSEKGKGTTFKIYFPRVTEEAEQYKHVPLAEVPKGTETILLAEDAEMVRHLAREILETNGYRVLEATSGKDALLICERYREPIDLLITDVVMPEMGGHELANRLASFNSEMGVLYMSGYTEDTIVHHGVLDAGINFIQKPFSSEALALKVREVLEAEKRNHRRHHEIPSCTPNGQP